VKLLAIDPGNIESAYVLMDGYKPVDFGKVQNNQLLDTILARGLAEWPDVVAIEMIASYGMPVGREVFDTCVWIGRYSLAMALGGTAVEYVYRQEVKLNLCGSSRAKDSNIRQALIDRFAERDLKNGKGTKAAPDYFYGFKADVWAAFSVGCTYLDTRKEDTPCRESNGDTASTPG
jgi:hypothetical protein